MYVVKPALALGPFLLGGHLRAAIDRLRELRRGVR